MLHFTPDSALGIAYRAVERAPERGAAKARLRLAEYRLGMLRGSRRLLTSGEPS